MVTRSTHSAALLRALADLIDRGAAVNLHQRSVEFDTLEAYVRMGAPLETVLMDADYVIIRPTSAPGVEAQLRAEYAALTR